MGDREDAIRAHYEPRIRKYTRSYQILDWETEESHLLRFEVLLDRVPLEGRSVLDIGCGVGDLYRFLSERVEHFEYTGVDILERMVDEAKLRHPGATFVCDDIACTGSFSPNSFSVVFCSGLFNLDIGENGMLDTCLPKFVEIARDFVVFNLLDSSSPDRDEAYVYYEPDRVAELVSRFCRCVEIVEGYLPNDFTVVMKLGVD